MKKEVAAVDVGSLGVGPLSACARESWILSVEVVEIDESWTKHNEDWVAVDGGAGVSACPVDYAPECDVKPGSVKLPLVDAGGDRIEHIGQKTVGEHATRDGANVEIAFEAAKVRRPLLSVGSLVEKGQDSGGFIIPRSAPHVDPAVRKLSMKRQNGHFWLPLARRVETSVNPVMVAPMEGAAEGAARRREDGRGVVCGGAVCSSGAEAWRTHARGAISPRGNALAVPRLVSHCVSCSVRPSSLAHRESGR